MRDKRHISSRLRLSAAAPFLALLAACGGGTGGTTSTPPPAPPPPAANPDLPPPTTVPRNFDTSEFRNSEGPGLHNAVAAWAAGHTGQGAMIAFVDNGIDEDSPEFAGRISPLSRDMTGNGRPLTGPDHHGTNLAMTAAAARDLKGVVGMAFGAELLVLRSDEPGTCSATGSAGSPGPTSCAFSDLVLAQGVTFAQANGAKVINISLGGGGVSTEMVNAVTNAVNAGALVVIAADNDSSPEPGGFARQLGDAGNGGVIVVGSIDDDGTISSFSNRAGSQADNFIMALGGGVCCVYENGEMVIDDDGFATLFMGTSYAAPQVSGAAALVAGAFPNLTGRQIAEILLESAFDAGAPGTDPEFGRGIMDIAAAFRPIGTTSLAGSGGTIALGDSGGSGSAAMGDAMTAVSLPAMILDKYARAFEVDFGSGFRGAQITPRLWQALGSRQRNLAVGIADTALGFTVDGSASDDLSSRLHPGYRAGHDSGRQEVLAARIAMDIGPATQYAFGYRQEAGGLVAQLQGQDRPGMMLAPSAMNDDGLFRRADAAFAMRHELADWGITASAEKAAIYSGSDWQYANVPHGRRTEDGVTLYGVALDRQIGPAQTALGLTWMDEGRTILGGRLHEAFGAAGADTLFIDAALAAELAPRWHIGAQLRHGRTQAREIGLVAAGSVLTSLAWSLDLERRGVFASDDGLALRIAQPLRVTGGSLDLNLPVAYSYQTQQAEFGIRSLSLAPQGREVMGEIGWRGSLLSGAATVAIFYRRDPGHYEQLPDDSGVALRWSRSI